MKQSTLQSLIRRNSNEIKFLEMEVNDTLACARDYEDKDGKAMYYKWADKVKVKISKLAKLQVELKKELKDVIYWGDLNEDF